MDSTGRIIIPIQSESSRLRLSIIAHAAGHSGHLGYHAALNLLKNGSIGLEWSMISEKSAPNVCTVYQHERVFASRAR